MPTAKALVAGDASRFTTEAVTAAAAPTAQVAAPAVGFGDS